MDQQILFSSEDQSTKSFDNFYAAKNSNILSALRTFLSPTNQFGCFYLFGEPGCGKTHLLKSAVSSQWPDSAYLNVHFQADKLRQCCNNKAMQLVAVDNVEELSDYEADMMLLFETLRQRSAKLILASRFAPKALSQVLSDLSSRFMSGQVFELKTLDDSEKVKALELRAKLRGFELSEEVINYVINRYPRDFNTLFGLLDKLDDASLQNQRKITIPFIRKMQYQANS